eukprot:8944883-Pyramimonas_sp.AAC.1
MQVFGSLCPSASAGDILIFVRKALFRKALFQCFTAHTFEILHEGRVAILTLQGPKGNLQLVSLHFDPDWTEGYTRQMMHRIRSHLSSLHSCVIAGDFNFLVSGEGRSSVRNGADRVGQVRLSNLFDEILHRFCEVE